MSEQMPQREKNEPRIPEGETGSKENPYSIPAGDAGVIVGNSWVLSSRWGAPAFFEFQDKTYRIGPDFSWKLESNIPDKEEAAYQKQRMDGFVHEVKEKYTKKRQ